MLQTGGLDPVLATSAEQALLQLEEQAFALVICDLNLPGISGLELLQHLSKRAPEIVFIVASGISDPEIGSKATANGAYGYLVKPFDRAQLLITVTNALHRPPARAAGARPRRPAAANRRDPDPRAALGDR